MNKIFFISDLHFGHKNIHNYTGHLRGNVQNVDEHDEWIIKQWNSVVSKSDLVWVLGDVSFSKRTLYKVGRLNGVKHLILGNHDEFPLSYYQKYFNKIHGFIKYKGYWLSHSPILDTRGLINIHGHTHKDEMVSNCGKYFCVCVEALNGKPIELEKINRYKNEVI